MPLPKSLTCSACKHTYPEGWCRCPYCGFDPEKERRDKQVERALSRKFPRFAAAMQRDRQRSRRPAGDDRPAQQQQQSGQSALQPQGEAKKRGRRRRGRRRGQGEGQPRVEGQPRASAQTDGGQQQRSVPPRDQQRREPRPQQEPRSPRPQQQNRPPRIADAQGQAPPAGSDAGSEAARRKRRRTRRRRPRPEGTAGPPQGAPPQE